MDTKGSGVVQLPPTTGAAVRPGVHPPLTQVPPPIDANGSGVAQLLVLVRGVQPPLTQAPPPIEAKGSGVAHPVAGGRRRWGWRWRRNGSASARSPSAVDATAATDGRKRIGRRASTATTAARSPSAVDATATAEGHKRIRRRASTAAAATAAGQPATVHAPTTANGSKRIWRRAASGGRSRRWRRWRRNKTRSGQDLTRRAGKIARIDDLPLVSHTASRRGHRVEGASRAPSVTICATVFGAPPPFTSTAPISKEFISELTARKDPLPGLKANAND